jgi:hypothetical protein
MFDTLLLNFLNCLQQHNNWPSRGYTDTDVLQQQFRAPGEIQACQVLNPCQSQDAEKLAGNLKFVLVVCVWIELLVVHPLLCYLSIISHLVVGIFSCFDKSYVCSCSHLIV